MIPTFIARTALILPLAIALGAQPAQADEVTEKAEAGLAELRFEDARTIATKGLEEGTRGPEELVTLYMILGQVSASLGESAEAERLFYTALSIDQGARLPDGISPKLSEPFAEAKKLAVDADPIALLSEVDDDGQLSVQITSDPGKLVGGAEARFLSTGGTESKRAMGSGTLRLEIPLDATELQVALIDEYGNRLSPLRLVEVSAGAKTTELTPTISAKESPSPPIYLRWHLYAGLAVGTLATGAYFGNSSSSKTDEIANLEDGTEFSVAQGLEDDARSAALIANIGFAATLGLGAVAVWMFINADSATESAAAQAQASTLVVPMVGADRVGVAASVRF